MKPAEHTDEDAVVHVSGLKKYFQVAERDPGLWGAVKGLFKRRYRTVKALDGISFSLQPGELLGFIGPNGAGKSTTIKILSSIMQADGGTCRVLGAVPWQNRKRNVARIGVVFGQRTQLWWDLPVIESYELLRDIYAIPHKQYARILEELTALLNLEGVLHTPVRQLSLGQRMMCDIAASLLHGPELLFLDEPTIGLDAVAKLAVRDFISRLNRDKGVTIILTTHNLDDIESLCRRILLIHQGRILYDGTLTGLRARVPGKRRLTIDLVDDRDIIDMPHATITGQEGHRVFLSFDPAHISAKELIDHILQAHEVRDLFLENPPIETLIARIYRDQQP